MLFYTRLLMLAPRGDTRRAVPRAQPDMFMLFDAVMVYCYAIPIIPERSAFVPAMSPPVRLLRIPANMTY